MNPLRKSIPLRDQQRLVRYASIAAVIVAGILISIKLAAYLLTNALSIKASLVDSILDSLASAINFFAILYAHRPADKEHRFGHGKTEALAGVMQAGFIIGSACFVLSDAVNRLINPTPIAHEGVGIMIMVISTILTIGLVSFQKYVMRRSFSLAISADSLHYQSDIMMNIGVIASIVVTSFMKWQRFDIGIAIAISIYIMYTAFGILMESVDVLMDRELPEEERQKIIAITLAVPGVLGVHDLRTRSSGNRRFIQFHLDLDETLPLRKAHDKADEIEHLLLAQFPDSEILIHQDPRSVTEHHVATFKDEIH